ncbi:MAG: ZIP family metal transporter [Gammaproteobacteria bacterium]|nr:ZIP family metal transporter [Gammaproteobacteria bacterium]
MPAVLLGWFYMSSGPLLILAGYSAAIIAASLLGGWLPSLVKMTHTRTQVAMSFVAGLMLGVALYHLLPHAIAQVGGPDAIDTVVWWVMAGLILMLLLLRSFHFHQHDFSAEEDDHHDHQEHGHPHGHGAQSLSWLGMAIGLSLHTLVDGVALGASIKAEWSADSGATFVGLGVLLAILLHKPLDALSITTLMKADGWSSRARTSTNISFSLMCPLGALLFFWGVGFVGGLRELVIGCALAFSAGVFLCISLSDLLPEVHFHSHDRGKLTCSFLLGIGLAYALGYAEPDMTHALEALP